MSVHKYANKKLRARLLCNDVPGWLCKHSRRRYIIAAVTASPSYVSPSSFQYLVDRRDALTKQTGVPHVMDHIVPLNHPKVSGLNVPWNIQVIPKYRNEMKSNHWYDHCGDWFSEPEQFAFAF